MISVFEALLFVLISLAPICNSVVSRNPANTNGVILPTCCPLDLSGTGKCINTNAKSNEENSYLWTIPGHLMSTNNSTKFRLQHRVSECKNKGNTTLLPLERRSNITSTEYFLPDGYLKIGNDNYPPQEYCINGTSGKGKEINLVIRVCKPSCRKRTPCITKCCPPNQLFDLGYTTRTKPKCVDHGDHSQYKPILYHNYDRKLSDIESQNIFPHIYDQHPKTFTNCKRLIFTPYGKSVSDAYEFYKGVPIGWKHFRLTKDGHMLYREGASKTGKCNKVYINETQICFDGVINYSVNATRFHNEEEETMFFHCTHDNPNNNFSALYGSLLLTTSIFALLTVVVYVLLWQKQNFRGWIIVSQATSLFFTNVFLGTGHIINFRHQMDFLETPACIFIGYATHFFFLTMFCWITVTGFDLWFTFRELKPSSSKGEGRRRLVAYSCFAWGVPTIFVTVGGILQNMADDTNCGDSDMDGRLITPGYGLENCYLSQQAFGTYLYYPATAMMAVTCVFFCVTIFKFYKYRKGTRMATKDESLTQFYGLTVKLFIVMGVTWIFEIFSFFLDVVGQSWHWIIFDILNCLRPIAFFAIFVCKSDIIGALRDNYPFLKPVLEPCSKVFPKKVRRSDSENATMTTGLSTKRSIS